jgi:carboxymethylenebutenolidase
MRSSHSPSTSPPVSKDAEEFLKPACPIVASYGAADRMLKGTAAKLETILTKAGVDHDIKEYPAAGHDFMTDHSQDRVPFLIKVVAAVLGGQYNPEAAKDSQKRILEFFAKHLKG